MTIIVQNSEQLSETGRSLRPRISDMFSWALFQPFFFTSSGFPPGFCSYSLPFIFTIISLKLVHQDASRKAPYYTCKIVQEEEVRGARRRVQVKKQDCGHQSACVAARCWVVLSLPPHSCTNLQNFKN